MAGQESGTTAVGHPYLQALLAAGVPVDQILGQAETLGCAGAELLRLAEGLAPGELAPLCLALGAASDWKPFLAEAWGLGLRLLEPLVQDGCGELDALVPLLAEGGWDAFRGKVLARLGHPGEAAGAGPERLAWLDQGRGLVLNELELSGFTSRARAWRQLLVGAMLLRRGAAPAVVALAPSRPWARGGHKRSVRLQAVRGLRSLEGLRHAASLVALACPELERLDAAPPVLVLKGCPGLAQVPGRRASNLLHLEDCPQLRTLGPAQDDPFGGPVPSTFRNLVLARCAALKELPGRMEVTGRMVLRDMGPFRSWPVALSVGDLKIQDCPLLEELPALEVQGSLRVVGASGLRRLAPGTVVGRHLDLRACVRLEGIPRGIRVGGALYLPDHLVSHGGWEPQAPLLEVQVDHYPVLRDLLLGLSFQGLCRSADRLATRERSEAALAELKEELSRDPRLETELVWTASEVWRDLAEELWAEEKPWSCGTGDAGSDLPLAWFRELLLSA